MSLEEILRVKEHGTGPVRDPELYFVSVFGTPMIRRNGAGASKGITSPSITRCGTAGLCRRRRSCSAPTLLWSRPDHGRMRNLADIEGPANKLLLSLNDEQRKEAVVSADGPDVTTTPNSAQPQPTSPEGSPARSSIPNNARSSLGLCRPITRTSPSRSAPNYGINLPAVSRRSTLPGLARPTRPSRMPFEFGARPSSSTSTTSRMGRTIFTRSTAACSAISGCPPCGERLLRDRDCALRKIHDRPGIGWAIDSAGAVRTIRGVHFRLGDLTCQRQTMRSKSHSTLMVSACTHGATKAASQGTLGSQYRITARIERIETKRPHPWRKVQILLQSDEHHYVALGLGEFAA